MKILSITFLFITLLFTSSVEEQSEAVYDACLPGSGDYCAGFADGREQPGWSALRWGREFNNCMRSRGCEGTAREKVISAGI